MDILIYKFKRKDLFSALQTRRPEIWCDTGPVLFRWWSPSRFCCWRSPHWETGRWNEIWPASFKESRV